LQSDHGDVAAVSAEDGFVQVVGEVRNPGEYRFVRGADLYSYLVKAGGPIASSDLSHIDLVRGPNRAKVIGRYDFSKPKDLPTILPGDLIVVQPDRPSTAEKVVPVVAGLVGIVNTILLLILLH
jgi:protein involved in polysaccharide export with SLBB domain